MFSFPTPSDEKDNNPTELKREKSGGELFGSPVTTKYRYLNSDQPVPPLDSGFDEISLRKALGLDINKIFPEGFPDDTTLYNYLTCIATKLKAGTNPFVVNYNPRRIIRNIEAQPVSDSACGANVVGAENVPTTPRRSGSTIGTNVQTVQSDNNESVVVRSESNGTTIPYAKYAKMSLAVLVPLLASMYVACCKGGDERPNDGGGEEESSSDESSSEEEECVNEEELYERPLYTPVKRICQPRVNNPRVYEPKVCSPPTRAQRREPKVCSPTVRVCSPPVRHRPWSSELE
jgi:hypothetical protein